MPMERASLKHVQTRKREIHCSGRKCETELENKAKELNKERRRKEKKEKEEQKKLTKLCDCVNSTVIRHSSTMTSSQQGSSNSSFCPPFEPCASSLVISRYLGDTLQNGTANGHGTAYFHAGHVYQGEFLVCFSVVSPLSLFQSLVICSLCPLYGLFRMVNCMATVSFNGLMGQHMKDNSNTISSKV